MPRVTRPARAQETAYTRDLLALARRMREIAEAALRPRLARMDSTDAFIGVDWPGLSARLLRVADGASTTISRRARALDRLSVETARVQGLGEAGGARTARVLEQWRRENVRLVRSIARRYHADLRELVREATSTGMRPETLAKRLEERYSVSRSRARLIARDQVLKANANLTRARAQDAGIERYVWSTSRDERVRPMHAELDGRTFSWSDPPVVNERGDRLHPGQDIQCRCVAVAVLGE